MFQQIYIVWITQFTFFMSSDWFYPSRFCPLFLYLHALVYYKDVFLCQWCPSMEINCAKHFPAQINFSLSLNSLLREPGAVSRLSDDRKPSVSPPLTFTNRHQLLHSYTNGLYCAVVVLWQCSVSSLSTTLMSVVLFGMDRYLGCNFPEKPHHIF